MKLSMARTERRAASVSSSSLGLRGSVMGFLIGIIPGSAHIISSFVSYGVERRLSKHPERFGHGAHRRFAHHGCAHHAACGAEEITSGCHEA